MNASIAVSFVSVIRLYNNLLSRLEVIDRDDTIILNRKFGDELGRLRLWAANIGAHQGGASSLEYRLRDASHIKTQILDLLHELQDAIQDAEDVLAERSSAKDFEDELLQIQSNVKTVVDCLFQMSLLARKPANHDFLRLDFSDEVLAHRPFYANHVRDKFPNAPKEIVERLALAMVRRLQYLKYRERHRAKLAKGLHALEAPSTGGKTSTYLSETKATDEAILQGNDDTRSESRATQTSYASVLLESDTIVMPPLPTGASNRCLFECPYCFVVISVDGTHAWHQHLFEDLQPYMCLVPGCSTPTTLYATRRKWTQHLRDAHPSIWTDSPSEDDGLPECAKCYICPHEADSKQNLIRHMATHLQELALFRLPRIDKATERGDDSRAHSLHSEATFPSEPTSPFPQDSEDETKDKLIMSRSGQIPEPAAEYEKPGQETKKIAMDPGLPATDRGPRSSDRIILKYRGVPYPLTFETSSISDGAVKVSDLRASAGAELKVRPQLVKLTFRGRRLLDDRKTCKWEGLKHNSHVGAIVSDTNGFLWRDLSSSSSEGEVNREGVRKGRRERSRVEADEDRLLLASTAELKRRQEDQGRNPIAASLAARRKFLKDTEAWRPAYARHPAVHREEHAGNSEEAEGSRSLGTVVSGDNATGEGDDDDDEGKEVE